MKSQIISKLHQIESQNDVTILYACESGSRAWGFDNEQSDYDVRFIYKRNSLKDYLSLSEKDEVIEIMDDDFDVVGWDIKKALLLHYNSNPNLREWIISPVKYIDFKIDIFKGLPDFDRAILKFHYTNIAKSNWKRLSDDDVELTRRVIKMYMYNCRCVLAWKVLDEGGNPSINIFDLLNQADDVDELIKQAILDLIDYYKGNCRDDLDLDLINSINGWMGDNLNIMRRDFPKKDKSRNLNDYDDRFYELLFLD